MLPIGTTTTVTNYILHRNAPLTALSTLGLSFILGANANFDFLPATFHDNRLWNTMGCAMLIGSSYLSHRSGDDHDGKAKPSCHGGGAETKPHCHGGKK